MQLTMRFKTAAVVVRLLHDLVSVLCKILSKIILKMPYKIVSRKLFQVQNKIVF
jgi:hypothetical protein